MKPIGSAARQTSLAYLNEEFIESDAGRPIRILSEYLAPLRALKEAHIHDTVVFFGSARIGETGPLQQYYQAARELAGKVMVLNLDAMVRHGVISASDLDLFHYADDPDDALQILKDHVQVDVAAPSPDLAKSATPCCRR